MASELIYEYLPLFKDDAHITHQYVKYYLEKVSNGSAMWAGFALLHLQVQLIQSGANISVYADRSRLNVLGAAGFRQVDADIDCLGVLIGHLPERVLDDDRRVAAHTQFQINHICALMPPNEILIAGTSGIPPLVLYEGVVAPQVHGHVLAADRAMRDKFCGDTHISLLCHHAPDGFLVAPGLLTAWLRTLPQAVVSLSIEQPFFIKACQLELMIHIGGKHKVIPIMDQFQQFVINGLGGFLVSVYHDLAAPPCPMFFQSFKRIKSGSVKDFSQIGLQPLA